MFFATVGQRNTGLSIGSPIVVSVEVHERDVIKTADLMCLLLLLQLSQSSLMWNQEVLAVPELVYLKDLHPDLLLLLHVDLGLGCSKSPKGRSMNL